MSVITRFAPSPTGYLHLGNIRTAIFSWLFAKKNKGKFLIRIEDTDIKRCNKKYINNIFFVLEWLGLYWDNEPYYQSKRMDLYKDIINVLLRKNLAYKCFCTNDRLNKIKYLCLKNNLRPKYDGYCKNNYNFINKKKYVVRFNSSLNNYNLDFNDKVYGLIKFNNIELDDFIIQRSNGIPTYNFCVIVDDYYMSITNVIRGSDHINNTFKQISIIKSLNFNIPIYSHLPILLDNKKKKLSKRNKLSDINFYIDKGFLPNSIINYLFKLGWSYKNMELFDIDLIKKFFDFKFFNKSSCIINYKKILWINRFYINKLNYNKFIFYLKPLFLKKNININNIYNICEIIFLIINRISLLNEIVDFYILINKNFNLDYNFLSKYKYKFIKNFLLYFKNKIYNLDFWSLNSIRIIINNSIKKFRKYCNIFSLLRYFLIGKEIGPNLDLIIFILRKKNVLIKLNKFKY